MTYHINVSKANVKEFLQIIQSLRSLGVVESYSSAVDLVRPGESIEEETMLNILEHSNNEIKKGKSISHEEVKKQLAAWKKK
jgi:predicted methyltransferase